MDLSKLNLNIISPGKKIFSGEISSIVFPGTAGSFGVGAGHAPLISSLKKGSIVYKIKSETKELEIERGVVEILNGVVSVCVEESYKK